MEIEPVYVKVTQNDITRAVDALRNHYIPMDGLLLQAVIQILHQYSDGLKKEREA